MANSRRDGIVSRSEQKDSGNIRQITRRISMRSPLIIVITKLKGLSKDIQIVFV